MKGILLGLTISLLASGIASAKTISEHQNRCEKQFDKFPEMVSCLSNSIKSDSDYDSDPEAKLYAAQARSLAAKVKRKAMHDEDAALELQEKYIAMNNRYRASMERKDDSLMSVIKDRMRQAPAIQQQQNTIIVPQQQKKNCNSPGGPINYQCIYAQ
ncbi:hypothetical protein [Serratia plymuthica]|uniref:hypothetical protein n=1 Tax=Serratia plymuthica TaxID=82996 RepID=UPI0007EC184E|nr:hypothetical protein [Serratia plymuthica]ANJ92429.1 hypothetical protein ADP72_05290 [Serratia plymuthica]